MPGSPFFMVSDSYQGVTGEGVPAAAGGSGSGGAGFGWSFWLWLFVIAVVIPGLILGSLRAGGYQMVFKRR
jgi:hypothetical protein